MRRTEKRDHAFGKVVDHDSVLDADVTKIPRNERRRRDGPVMVEDNVTTSSSRSGRVTGGRWAWWLLRPNYRSARALQRHGMGTLIGMIFYFYSTLSGRHPCLSFHISFGDDTSSVSSVYWVLGHA